MLYRIKMPNILLKFILQLVQGVLMTLLDWSRGGDNVFIPLYLVVDITVLPDITTIVTHSVVLGMQTVVSCADTLSMVDSKPVIQSIENMLKVFIKKIWFKL